MLLLCTAGVARATGELGGQAADADLEALLLEEFDEGDHPADPAERDPFEECNRAVFGFNRGVDYVFFDPITKGYQWLVPKPVRKAVERATTNLDSPVMFINQILQLRMLDSAGTLGRFLINTSFGLAGLFDPAGRSIGISRVEADFGQTMARYGVPDGPYVMLPVFGPSTARDAVGTIIDQAADPLTYFIGPLQWWGLLIGGGQGLVVREASVEELNALEEGSVDFYSALRSAYLQSRDALIQEATGIGEAGVSASR